MSTRDWSKLPKWAQRERERLERDLEHFKARLSEGPENSDTFANPHSAAPRPLGSGTTILFNLGKEQLRVRTAKDRNGVAYLDVSGSRVIAVFPQASNALSIGVMDR